VGGSEVSRLGEEVLGKLRPGSVPYSSAVKKLLGLLRQSPEAGQQGGSGPHGRWTHADWAKTRQDWLDNRWRHDWRSQPRDVEGRWVPGRLSYVDAKL